ncbi:hypothetical protein C8R31_101633 [Nitrosospira sp. Nsp2]|uniref:hypothetical protein n=1 Tax=Nitrosospira sp. Nsp2 TaxID=136548 RepID=UPI000D327C3A|nr:hypothetical protein [Nitrosospira sp. Nsp2]PTR17469.1 hypothetical protein C8R31_101633 [Nitrosospira sp. Nsp2]
MQLEVAKEKGHTTEQELRFIDELGSHADTKLSRKNLLRLYISAASKRTHWGSLDRFAVVSHAQQLLAPAAHSFTETPPSPTSAAHAEINIAREENPEPAAQAAEPVAQPEETHIEAAVPAAPRKRGRPRKQAVLTPAAEVVE